MVFVPEVYLLSVTIMVKVMVKLQVSVIPAI